MARARRPVLLAAAIVGLSCGNFPREYRLGHAPRTDPRLVLQGSNPYISGAITIELDEPGYVGVFLVSSGGFVRLFYPYLRNQATHFEAGRHRIRGERPRVGGPLVILVSNEPIEFERLDEYVADDVYSGAGYNPGNAYRAVYDLGRGTLEETLQVLPTVVLRNADAPMWSLYYYRP